MKKLLLLVLLMVFTLSPLLADEESYSFACEELYQRGKQSAPKWSKRWFYAGLGISLASTLIGTAIGLESEEDSDILVGLLGGAGVGMGISILLPLMITLPPSNAQLWNEESNKCYADGYLCKARATNTVSSFTGALLGAPLAPVGMVVGLTAGLLDAVGQLDDQFSCCSSGGCQF
jgi:hypothetical protein